MVELEKLAKYNGEVTYFERHSYNELAKTAAEQYNWGGMGGLTIWIREFRGDEQTVDFYNYFLSDIEKRNSGKSVDRVFGINEALCEEIIDSYLSRAAS